MNASSLSGAKKLLIEAAGCVERPVAVEELLRFAYYYALHRKEREEKATQWLEIHRPEVASQLAAEHEEAATAAPSNEDLVRSAIALADQATIIQSRVRGKKARERTRERAATDRDPMSLWGAAMAEQRRRQLSQLKMENEMLRRNEGIATTRLQAENARLDGENRRLLAENQRLLSRATTETITSPPQGTTEERLAALNWLVRSKSGGVGSRATA